jgi:RNA polymerase sigma factor (sigma-70 family)
VRVNALDKRDALASHPSNLRLVVSLAKKVHSKLPSCFDLDDLAGVGNVALLRAASRYDPAVHDGTPFSAFARIAIRGAMVESIRRNKYVENTRVSVDDPNCEWERMSVPSPEAAIDRSRLIRRVARAIGGLPAQHRRLVKARYARDEPSFRELARRLGIPTARAETMHAEAIAMLRADLELSYLPQAA